MSNKEKVCLFFSKNAFGFFCFFSVLVITVIELILLQLFPEWIFGFTALSLGLALIKLGAHIFGKSKKCTCIFLLCILANVVVLNRLYVYAALVKLFPQLNQMDSLQLLLTGTGLILFTMVIVKWIIWILNRTYIESSAPDAPERCDSESAREKASVSSETITTASVTQRKEGYKYGEVVLVALVIIAVLGVIVGCIYYLAYNEHMGNLSQLKEKIPETIQLVFGYGLIVALIILAVIAIGTTLLEFIRFFFVRIRSIRKPLSEEDKRLHIPTYVLSVSIVLIVLSFSYFKGGYALDDLIDSTLTGEYLALPLQLLVLLGIFLLMVQFVNWFLKALVEPHKDDEGSSYQKIDKAKRQIIEIIGNIIFLLLDMVQAVILFIKLVPDFVYTFYYFVVDTGTSSTPKSNNAPTENGVEDPCKQSEEKEGRRTRWMKDNAAYKQTGGKKRSKL